MLNIDAHSSTPLRAGRWFFGIIGASFMQSSIFQVVLLLTNPANDAKNENSDSNEIILIEHQKFV